eukprot:3581062-Amphidinium_carterae.1
MSCSYEDCFQNKAQYLDPSSHTSVAASVEALNQCAVTAEALRMKSRVTQSFSLPGRTWSGLGVCFAQGMFASSCPQGWVLRHVFAVEAAYAFIMTLTHVQMNSMQRERHTFGQPYHHLCQA